MEHVSAGQDFSEQDLLLVCLLPDPSATSGCFYSTLRKDLLSMYDDPAITLLALKESMVKAVSLEKLFIEVLTKDSPEVWYNVIITPIKISITFV